MFAVGVGIHRLGGQLNLLLPSAGFAHELTQSHGIADRLACGDIFFAKGRHEDVAVGDTVVVVDDADEAVGCLLSIGIGHAEAFVEHESAGPGLAVVFGEVGGEMRAAGACVERAVLHKQQIARRETTDEESRRRVQKV